MANTKMIHGEPHVQQGNGLYRQLAGDKTPDGKAAPKYFVGSDGEAYEALEDVVNGVEIMVARGALVAECSKDGSGDKATMVLADRPVALPGLDGNGKRTWSTVAKNDWINCTEWDSVQGVPAAKPEPGVEPGREPGPEGWNVDYMACSPGDARVMWLNFPQGEPGPNGIETAQAASVPVAMLFNENSSCGEVRPLLDVTVEQASWADKKFEAGNNVVVSLDDLSEEPLDAALPENIQRLTDLIELRDKIYGSEAPDGPEAANDREFGA